MVEKVKNILIEFKSAVGGRVARLPVELLAMPIMSVLASTDSSVSTRGLIRNSKAFADTVVDPDNIYLDVVVPATLSGAEAVTRLQALFNAQGVYGACEIENTVTVVSEPRTIQEGFGGDPEDIEVVTLNLDLPHHDGWP